MKKFFPYFITIDMIIKMIFFCLVSLQLAFQLIVYDVVREEGDGYEYIG